MMSIGWIFGLLTALSGMTLASSNQQNGRSHVQATLLANVNAIVPGKAFTVGVLLHMQPGWHIYWKNSGDAGLPTEVHWRLPRGFTASELKWPAPQRFAEEAGIVTFGYAGETMLIAEITPPSHLKNGEEIVLNAGVKWLECDQVCIPGKAEVSLKLPVGTHAEPDSEDVFAKYSAMLPRDAIKADGLKVRSSAFKAAQPKEKLVAVLNLSIAADKWLVANGKNLSRLEFFSEAMECCAVERIEYPEPKELRRSDKDVLHVYQGSVDISVVMKSFGMDATVPDKVRGVLVAQLLDGTGKAMPVQYLQIQ